MIKILICGSRSFTDENYFNKYLTHFFNYIKSKTDEELIIVSGKAKGPDSFAIDFAIKNNIKLEEYPADWDKYGKSAGFIRNKEMVSVSNITIAFFDGISKGTKDSIELSEKKGIPVFIAGKKEVKKILNLESLEKLLCKNQPEL
jgi:hypothetical protein